MSTESPTPAVETPAPAAVAPVAAPKHVTPALPKGQAESAPTPKVEAPPHQQNPNNKTEEDFKTNLRKISKDLEAKQVESEKPAAVAKAAEAPAAPEAKTAEAPAAEGDDFLKDIAPPDAASDGTKKGWKALKDKANAEIAASKKQLADATAQIETFRKATPAEAADMAKIKADLQAANDRLAVLDYTATSEYRTRFADPKQKAMETVKSLLTDNAVEDAPDFASLLNKPRAEFAKAVSEAAQKMPIFDQADFTNALRDAYRINGDEKTAISKASELSQAIASKNAAQQKVAFEETFTEFGNKMKPIEIPADADEDAKAEIGEYNKALASIRPTAEAYAFGKIDDKGVAALAAKAAALDFLAQKSIPRLQRDFDRKMTNANTLIKELTTKLEGVRAAKNPGTFSASEAPATNTGPKSFADIAKDVGMRNP